MKLERVHEAKVYPRTYELYFDVSLTDGDKDFVYDFTGTDNKPKWRPLEHDASYRELIKIVEDEGIKIVSVLNAKMCVGLYLDDEVAVETLDVWDDEDMPRSYMHRRRSKPQYKYKLQGTGAVISRVPLPPDSPVFTKALNIITSIVEEKIDDEQQRHTYDDDDYY